MSTPTVPINEIEIGSRYRKDYGELDQLCQSIVKNGLISPVAVGTSSTMKMVTDGACKYVLLAGGRRMAALKKLNWTDIPVRIYTKPLSVLDLRSIELAENFDRKEMTFVEECALMKEINSLQIQIHGEKIGRSSDAPGWSQNDTAQLLGKSSATVALDLKLANAMESHPELGLANCKNKSDAMKKLNSLTKTIGNSIAAEKYTNSAGATSNKVFRKLSDSYIINDCLEVFKNIPSSSQNFIEIDPPYAIDLKNNKKGNDCSGYNEINIKDYEALMTKVFSESYRTLKEGSWLICWFGPDPWFDTIGKWLKDAGFKLSLLPAIWTKPSGQTMQPERSLGNAYEMFFYARKGEAKLQKPGRSNIFEFKPVNPTDKYHPTQRPLPLMEEIYRTFTSPGTVGFIPFAGSGVGILAGHNLSISMIASDLTRSYKDGFTLELQKVL